VDIKNVVPRLPMSQQNAGVDELGGVASNSGRLGDLDTVPLGIGVNILLYHGLVTSFSRKLPLHI
jgi:hypothetical protein